MPHFDAPDGTRLYYEDAGDGVPVLCLSGLTRNARDFDYVAPHLDGVRLIRMDYRGRGLSEHADPATYAVPVEAKDTVALLDHLGVDKAAVLGTSRGGLIALILGAIARDRLLGVAFNDVGPVVDPAGLADIMTYLGVVPQAASLEALAQDKLADPDFPGVDKTRWRSFLSHNVVEGPEGLRLNYDLKLRDAVAAVFDQPAPDLWPVYDLLADLPCAVIRGANSNLLSEATLQEMARRHPGLITATVPDRGHIPFLDEPQALDALRLWLEQIA
ncbi:Pimeloyl-ACP methyl ester carboxylesterase [Pseudooceanicola nitratireducens]|jgi:pimeloyl-ACP methyl ester carboxylesterase|uniref:Pimeloyl-ACP methyl ester carboxylesterase n=1 Tax=Pseudooceanicola nitratireducens TaxID=517719 RepID=A0A1I1NQZ6_9RHOB|nr:alpha/beta hydrolase [Pseudooceanicola nitratireducens]SEI66466.1 Pimeloyl-ACP methyl ester carboxylesterase [Pseudooceanicola nitratireducens]SFC99846.1 Pimeloyl-ACP methyl ester carboxylesterase [Pseudooceanicola nitratireducens]